MKMPSRSLTALGLLCALLAAPAPAGAVLSGRAEPGDNCTPFNTYKIGYRTASQARIVQQGLVLERGWLLVGWTVRDGSDMSYFIPYAPYFDRSVKDVSGTAPSMYLLGKGRSDPSRGYEVYVQTRQAGNHPLSAPSVLERPYLVADCFSEPLS